MDALGMIRLKKGPRQRHCDGDQTRWHQSPGTTRYTRGAARDEHIGFIPFLTTCDNMVLAMTLNGTGSRDTRKRARAAAIPEDRHPCQTPAGESLRWRAAAGRHRAGTSQRTPLILAGGPTASLDMDRDKKVGERLRRVDRECNSAGITVTCDRRMITGLGPVCRLKDRRRHPGGGWCH